MEDSDAGATEKFPTTKPARRRGAIGAVASRDRRHQIELIKEYAIEPVLVELGAERAGARWRCFNKTDHKRRDATPAGSLLGAYYKCFACGASGDAISLMMQHRGMTFIDAGRHCARAAGYEWPELGEESEAAAREHASARDVATVYERLAEKWSLHKDAAERLAGYMIGADGAALEALRAELGIGYAGGPPRRLIEYAGAGVAEARRADALRGAGLVDEKGDVAGGFHVMCSRGGITYPITENGRIVQIKVRLLNNGDGAKNLQFAGRRYTPWGLDYRRDAAIVLVEGEGDRLAVMLAAPDVAAVAVGTSLHGAAGEYWRAALARLMKSGRRVYIALDDDAAGRASAMSLAAALPGAYLIRFGAGDARDCLAAGALDVGAAIADCRSLAALAPAPTKLFPRPPWGWALDDRGLHKWIENRKTEKSFKETVAPLPIWPVAVYRNVTSGSMELEIAFGAAPVKTARLPRSTMLGAGVAALADFGAPIFDGNRKDISAFLLGAETEWALPVMENTARLGWCGSAFVLGDQCIGGAIRPSALGAESQGIIEAAARRGDRDAWLALIKKSIKMSDAAAFGIFASALSPLLSRCGIKDSFMINYWGTSSIGKTTIAALALSLWYRPDAGYRSWNLSDSSFEDTAGTLHNLPFLLDEVGKAPNWKRRGNLVYTLGNNQGRPLAPWSARGRVTPRWHLIAFSTGEEPVLAGTVFEGQGVRCIEITEAPYPPNSEAFVKTVNTEIHRSHGFGAEWLRAAIAVDWSAEIARGVIRSAGGVEGRLADIGAAVAAVGRHFCAWLGEEPSMADVIVAKIMESQERQRAEAGNYVDRSLDIVASWIEENRIGFAPKRTPVRRLGVVDHGYCCVAILPRALEEMLRNEGFEPRTVFKRWKEGGIIDTDPGHLTKKHQIKDSRPRCIVIPFEKLEERITFMPETEEEAEE